MVQCASTTIRAAYLATQKHTLHGHALHTLISLLMHAIYKASLLSYSEGQLLITPEQCTCHFTPYRIQVPAGLKESKWQ